MSTSASKVRAAVTDCCGCIAGCCECVVDCCGQGDARAVLHDQLGTDPVHTHTLITHP